MAETPATFSESWHRVASQRIRLRPGVKVRRQFFRGELWYVLEDPFTNQFFRLRPSAHGFIARFDGQRTVQEAWQGHLDADADNAPGQEEVIRLLSQLYAANLLQYESPGDSAALADRQRKRRERETAARWMNIMFLRIPLVDPDRFLDALMPLWRIMFSTFGALVWLGVVGWAVKVGIDNFPQLVLQTEGVLAPGNLPLLYLGMAIIKALHELGHSAACKRFGGEVHVLGVMLLIFTPVPYMDATAELGFPQPLAPDAGRGGRHDRRNFRCCHRPVPLGEHLPRAPPQPRVQHDLHRVGLDGVVSNANPLLRL